MSPRFEILIVCTGNICRSPLAENMLRAQLNGTEDISVSSAGTHALVGEPMDATVRGVSQRYGLSDEQLEAHLGRELNAKLLQAADLVLTMTGDQRRQVVELSPRSTRRVFTLKEFARLAAATTPSELSTALADAPATPTERLRTAVRTVTLSRDALPPLEDISEIDILDPYRQSEDVHVATAASIHEAVVVLSELFRRVLG